ncbi:cytochrome P450 [Streptomyces sp. PSKA30]|nr:cytochrome P450 [Streptomyces sp. PSKA30]
MTQRPCPATRGSFLAFGDGRRKCIGENFAWSELQIILATILQCWPRFSPASRAHRPSSQSSPTHSRWPTTN